MGAMDNIVKAAKEVKKQLQQEKKQYIIRVEGIAGQFGIGEVVAPGCTLFKAGMYGLTRDQAEKGAKHLGVTFPYQR